MDIVHDVCGTCLSLVSGENTGLLGLFVPSFIFNDCPWKASRARCGHLCRFHP